MIVFPNAKINIGLNIVAKRPDGYHDLETIFYPIKIHDALEAITAPLLNFNSSGINIPGDAEKNLCIKAYQLVSRNHTIPPLNIHLHKHIPIGAGLGGGSADAAFFIKMLNDIFSLKMSVEEMEDYSRHIGADCAFFIHNKPVFAHGKGDQFEQIQMPDLSSYWVVIAMPPVHVSTAEAYAGVVPKHAEISLKDAIQLPVGEWKNAIKNDFETSVFEKYPAVKNLKSELYNSGALYASMSGSGAAVFGIFETMPNLKHLEKDSSIFYKV